MTNPTFANVSYHPLGAGASNPKQFCNVYIPPGTPPAGGWPWLLHATLGFYINSELVPTLEQCDGLVQTAFAAGFACIDASLTISNQTGGVYADGGMFRLPTDPEWDIEGGGADIPELDCVWLIQKCIEKAATWGLDAANGFGASTSAGGNCMAYAASAPDWAEPGSAIVQVQQSTRGMRGIILSLTQGWAEGYMKAGSGGSVFHLRKLGALTLPALEFGLAVPAHVVGMSFFVQLTATAARSDNAVMPYYMRAGQGAPGVGAIGTITYDLDPTTLLPTYASTTTTGITAAHDPAGMVWLRKILHELSPFHDTASRLIAPTSWTTSGISPDAVITSLSAYEDDAVSWMSEILAASETAATLNMRMDWAADVEVLCTGVQTPRSGGMVQRRQTATVVSKHFDQRAVRRWHLNWKSASRSEHDLLLEIWRTARGPVRPITFFPPDGGSVVARFVGDSFRSRQVNARTLQMGCVLEEVP